jgi:hypothetical protein
VELAIVLEIIFGSRRAMADYKISNRFFKIVALKTHIKEAAKHI